MSLVLETTLGNLEIDLYIKNCPTLCYNFIKLCKIKYYNFTLFHSIQKDFVAQTGDPSGLGKWGSSIFGVINGPERRYFRETRAKFLLKHARPGLLSMVNCGDDMFSSQFFITLGSNLHSLDREHIVFGEVVDSSEVLIKFNDVITDHFHRPYTDVRITHTVILHDPFEDPDNMLIPSRSPSPNEGALKNSRLDPDQRDPSDEVRSESEKVEILKEKDALAQATILEMIGDLPSYDIAPPENVLFVCHLNPVTTDDDLKIIFSRFGTIKSAKVIRDRTSEESLQYAFVEFQSKQSCEEAYMKMEGVLIDERRIHVDFGQSVAKYIQRNGRGDQKEERRIRKVTPRDSSGRHEPKGDLKYDEQQSGRGFHRKESRRDGDRHSTSRKHDSRRRKPFACNESSHPRGDGSYTCKERWQEHSKSREERHDRKQMGKYYDCVQRDKTERGSNKYASHSEGHRRRHRSRERSYDDESQNKECKHVSGRKKQKQGFP